jgi:hypothetical protein
MLGGRNIGTANQETSRYKVRGLVGQGVKGGGQGGISKFASLGMNPKKKPISD